MEIRIDVSEYCEATRSPWWVIIDPKQMMKPSVDDVAMTMLTGPFFSRDEAEQCLRIRRHHYSDRAKVWCMSGCYTQQYDSKCQDASRKLREKLSRPAGEVRDGHRPDSIS